MALIDLRQQIIHCKVVYYGPSMAGKTSSLQYIHSQTPADERGDLLSFATVTERTLSFELTPPDHPMIGEYALRFHLYTVPGAVLYTGPKMAVLSGVDGVIFVADSQAYRLADNIDSLQDLRLGLSQLSKSTDQVPIVLQYNKRDLPTALPVNTMDTYLNLDQWPRFESVIREWDPKLRTYACGLGVFEAFSALESVLRTRLKRSAGFVA